MQPFKVIFGLITVVSEVEDLKRRIRNIERELKDRNEFIVSCADRMARLEEQVKALKVER